MTEILVSIAAAPWHSVPECRDQVMGAARAALEGAGLPAELAARAELGIELSDDAAVHALNRHFRDRDKPTNVLSFPGYDSIDAALAESEAMTTMDDEAPPVLLGDVILAFETVAREAEAQGKTVAAHMMHLVVHGVLHLLGYDHDTPETAARMEDLERRVLAPLDVPDPYLVESLRPENDS